MCLADVAEKLYFDVHVGCLAREQALTRSGFRGLVASKWILVVYSQIFEIFALWILKYFTCCRKLIGFFDVNSLRVMTRSARADDANGQPLMTGRHIRRRHARQSRCWGNAPVKLKGEEPGAEGHGPLYRPHVQVPRRRAASDTTLIQPAVGTTKGTVLAKGRGASPWLGCPMTCI